MISMAVIRTSTPCANAPGSNSPSSLRNFIRFNEARLQAVSSRNMYSEQGFDAFILPEAGQGFHRLMVVSNCMPGSPHSQAASAISCMTSPAGFVQAIAPSMILRACQSFFSATACMNASVARTELLARSEEHTSELQSQFHL